MHDLSTFQNDLDAIEKRLADRGFELDVDGIQRLGINRRAAINRAEQAKASRNALTLDIGVRKRAGEDTTAAQYHVRSLAGDIANDEKMAKDFDEEFRKLLAGIPNIPHESVPTGKSAADNVEVRRVGTPPQFDFTPKPHWELGPELGILDFERAAKSLARGSRSIWGWARSWNGR